MSWVDISVNNWIARDRGPLDLPEPIPHDGCKTVISGVPRTCGGDVSALFGPSSRCLVLRVSKLSASRVPRLSDLPRSSSIPIPRSLYTISLGYPVLTMSQNIRPDDGFLRVIPPPGHAAP